MKLRKVIKEVKKKYKELYKNESLLTDSCRYHLDVVDQCKITNQALLFFDNEEDNYRLCLLLFVKILRLIVTRF